MLGVPKDADLKQIKQAFKRKALKLHPDVNKAVSGRHPLKGARKTSHMSSANATAHVHKLFCSQMQRRGSWSVR